MLVAKQRERDPSGAEHLKGARRRGVLTNCPKAREKPRATTVQSLTSSTENNTDDRNGFALASRGDTAISRILPSKSVIKATFLKHTKNTGGKYILVHSAGTAPVEGTPLSTVAYSQILRTRAQFSPMLAAR